MKETLWITICRAGGSDDTGQSIDDTREQLHVTNGPQQNRLLMSFLPLPLGRAMSTGVSGAAVSAMAKGQCGGRRGVSGTVGSG